MSTNCINSFPDYYLNKMALGRISNCLDSTSGLPTDVRFVFKKEGGSDDEVKAHKLILAIASDVFKRQFFGSMYSEDVIEIEDASREVFKTMIDYIYHKKIVWSDLDLNFLTSMYYLADKYDIEKIKMVINCVILKYKVSEENVMEVAILAEDYCHHEQLSESLYNISTAFLKRKFAGKVENVFNYCSETEPTALHGLVLLKLMARMNNKCGNCKRPLSSCRNKHEVSLISLVIGAKVSELGTGSCFELVGRHPNRPDLVLIAQPGVAGQGYIDISRCYYRCV